MWENEVLNWRAGLLDESYSIFETTANIKAALIRKAKKRSSDGPRLDSR